MNGRKELETSCESTLFCSMGETGGCNRERLPRLATPTDGLFAILNWDKEILVKVCHGLSQVLMNSRDLPALGSFSQKCWLESETGCLPSSSQKVVGLLACSGRYHFSSAAKIKLYTYHE